MDYWIAIDNEKIGPLSLSEVRSRHLSADTLVWHNGLSTWCKAGSLPELAGTLAGENDVEETSSCTPTQEEMPESDRPIPTIPAYVMQAKPGEPAIMKETTTPPPAMPRSYLGWSIAAIILCCTIPAIVSLVYATRVAPRYNRGDYEGARKASENAEIWFIVSIVFGLVQLPFTILFNMF